MEEIMNEIAEFCEDCTFRESCKEEECILWRIEQLALEQQKED